MNYKGFQMTQRFEDGSSLWEDGIFVAGCPQGFHPGHVRSIIRPNASGVRLRELCQQHNTADPGRLFMLSLDAELLD
jgi:hypothetical protein